MLRKCFAGFLRNDDAVDAIEMCKSVRYILFSKLNETGSRPIGCI